MKKHITQIIFGEVFVQPTSGVICARVRTKSGRTYVHVGEGRGFASKIQALDFVHKSVQEGVITTGRVFGPEPRAS